MDQQAKERQPENGADVPENRSLFLTFTFGALHSLRRSGRLIFGTGENVTRIQTKRLNWRTGQAEVEVPYRQIVSLNDIERTLAEAVLIECANSARETVQLCETGLTDVTVVQQVLAGIRDHLSYMTQAMVTIDRVFGVQQNAGTAGSHLQLVAEGAEAPSAQAG
jgi:hypothetical protein